MSTRREPRKKKDRNYSHKKATGLQATDPRYDVRLPAELLDDIRTLIEEARTRVATAVNIKTVMLNWRIGQPIWREILGEERAEYGKRIVYALSRQLSWTHLRTLMYLDDPLQREFYTQMCRVEREMMIALNA